MKTRHYPNKLCGRRRLGFSLVELVVVILIIAVLAVAVYAGGSAAIKKSRVARTTSDLHNFQVAAEATLTEMPSVANIPNNNMASGSLLPKVIRTFDDNLGADFRLKSYEPLTTVDAGNLKIKADVTDTGMYAIFESKKLDAWSNPYYVLFDSSERHEGASDFSITVASAGPNSVSTIGGDVEADDILMVAQSTNNQVSSRILSFADVATIAVEQETLKVAPMGYSGVQASTETSLVAYTGKRGLTVEAVVNGNGNDEAGDTNSTTGGAEEPAAQEPEPEPTPSFPSNNYLQTGSGLIYCAVYTPDPSIEFQLVIKYGRLIMINRNDLSSQVSDLSAMGNEITWYSVDSMGRVLETLGTGYYYTRPDGNPL